MTIGQKFKPDELIASIDPIYRIYMVFGEGWYVVNGLTKQTRFFDFKNTKSYLEVLDYAESLC